MYFQLLIEDQSASILMEHLMEKLQEKYPDQIWYKIKSFSGIGTLSNSGSVAERKTNKLLNELSKYLKGFDKLLAGMENACIVVVLDNDQRKVELFRSRLEEITRECVNASYHVICLAIKEMEAWLLGDEHAVETAYPNVRKKYIREYIQDSISPTWEILADAVYPGGYAGLMKTARKNYSIIGKAKCEWADRIGMALNLEGNKSPSFQYMIHALEERIAEV